MRVGGETVRERAASGSSWPIRWGEEKGADTVGARAPRSKEKGADAGNETEGGGAPSAAGIEPLRAGEGARLAANDGLKAETQSMNERKSPCMKLEGCGVASN